MDKRNLRSKKSRPRSARPHDRQNQSIFGKVCSTVKGLLNPSWLISGWMGNAENESETLEEETVREDNDIVCPSVSHGGNKRLRLRFDESAPSIQNSGTQTWPEQPSQNLYDSISHVQSASTQSQLEKETIAVLNGDDHSENSEGSASTSGCSSLVSSHKESNKLVESPFVSLLELKNSRKRKLSASKSGLNDLNSSRTLWSSPTFQRSSNFQRRLPTISNTNQPSFNLSTFVGPSKLNDSIDKKVSSPFYEGRTTFGGASASRRMPPTVSPYQVDKSRNKIRIRDTSSDDNLEGMSSAAKRILLTLEKMSSPVADARKVPNTDTSPIDVSLYLTPPKSHRNSQFTPSIAGKGPPIANINNIAKLATLKNYGASRLRSTLMSPLSTDSKMEKKSDVPANMFGVVFSDSMESALPSSSNLPKENIPILSCDTRQEKKTDMLSKPFVFSNPIELELPNSNLLPKEDTYLSPALDSKIKKNSNIQPKPFVFSSPIEHELPNNNVLHKKENVTLPTSSTATVSATDSPFSSWGQNSHAKFKTSVTSDTPQVTKEPISGLKFKGPEITKSSPVVSSTATAASTGFSFTSSAPASQFKFGNSSPSLFSFGAPKTESQNVSPVKPLTFGSASSTSTWECDACWVRNPETDLKCKACETPRTQKEKQATATPTRKINSTDSNAFSTWECSSCWVRNPMKEKKCMACETLHPNADKTSNFSFKDLEKAKTSTSVSLPTIQPTKPMLGVFGNKDLQSDTQKTTSVSTFSFGSASNASTWECNTCLIRNPEAEAKCKACEAPRPSKDSSSKGVEKNQAASTVSSSLSQTTATPVLSVSTAATTPSAGFVFGVPKSDAQSTALAPFSFGSGLDKNKATSSVSQSGTALPNASTTTTVSTGAFVFAAPKTDAPSATAAPFVFGSTSNASTWECNTCLIRNPQTEAKCKACEAPRPSKDSSSKGGFTFKSESTSSGALATSQSSSGLNTNTTAAVSSGGFVFGAPKTENQSLATTPFAFGSGVDKIQATSTVASSLSQTTTPLLSVSTAASTPSAGFVFGAPKTEAQSTTVVPFSFGSASNASTWECNTCLIRNPETEAKCKACEAPRPSKDSSSKGGFTFKSESASSGALATSQSSSGLNFNTTAPVSSGGFVFGAAKTENQSLTSTPFSFGSASTASTWECTTCLIRNPLTEAKCKACEAPRPSKDSSSKGGFTFKSESTNSGALATSQSSSGLNTTAAVSSGGFVFGAVKTENQSLAPTPFAFGSGVDKSQATTTVSSSLSQTTAAPLLSVSTAASTPSAGFVFGIPKTEAQSTAPAPFSFGSGLDKNQAMPSAPSSVSQSGAVLPNASTATTASTGAFVFGAPKSEAQSSTSAPFVFGSGTISTNTSAFSAFPASQSANPPFKFGSQPTGSSSTAVISTNNFSFAKSEPSNQIPSSAPQNSLPVFGSTNSNFVFSAKNVTSLQIPSTVSQAPSPAFGALNTNFSFSGKTENSAVSQNPAPPAFGSTSMQSVWNPPAPAAVQSFGAATSSVFQFGAANTNTNNNNNSNADKKRTASGFSPFMTQSTPETNNSFPTVGFNVSTPPSFNFGATSTPAGTTFQFAASSSPKPAPQSQNASRKIKKAFRRVTRRD